MKRYLVIVSILVFVISAPLSAGGPACKVIIDDGNGQAMAAQFAETLKMIDRSILLIEPYMTAEEKHKAVQLSYETCDIAEELQKFTEKLTAFYIALGKKYAYAPAPEPDEGKGKE